MKLSKKFVATGASLAVIASTVAGVGLVSAASNDNGNTLVDKIATKFNLNKTDVQQVFDQNREEHRAEMKAKAEEKLAQAVKDGKLTQAQADHIKSVEKEIGDIIGNKKPGELDQSTRDAIKSKRDDLKKWTDEQGIKLRSFMFGPHGHGRGGHHQDQDNNSDNGSDQ